MKILIVDDIKDYANAIRHFLKWEHEISMEVQPSKRQAQFS